MGDEKEVKDLEKEAVEEVNEEKAEAVVEEVNEEKAEADKEAEKVDEMKKKAGELLAKMKSEFYNDTQTKMIYEKVKNVVEPTLERWADAVVQMKFGPEADREINKDIIKSCCTTIAQIKVGCKQYLKNYAVEKMSDILKDILIKYVLPIATI